MPAPFDEKGFREFVEGEGKIWFREKAVRSSFASFDGKTLGYVRALRDDPAGVIVVSHGFTEYADKYLELIYDLWESNFSVFVIEHRGHGYSCRLIPENDRVDIDSFDTYVEDLKFFTDNVVDKTCPGLKKMLFCHSMGCTIGSLFLERYPGYYERAIFCSPFFRMLFSPRWEIIPRVLFVVSLVLGWNDRLLPGQAGFADQKFDFEHSPCTSKERYGFDVGLRLSDEHFHTTAGTYTWARAAVKALSECTRKSNAAKIDIPVLILRAGLDDIVDVKGIDTFLKGCSGARVVDFPDAKHEIFNSSEETVGAFFNEVFGFFG